MGATGDRIGSGGRKEKKVAEWREREKRGKKRALVAVGGGGRGSFALLTNINASWGAQCSEKREEKRRRNRNHRLRRHRLPLSFSFLPPSPPAIKGGARKEFLWAAKGDRGEGKKELFHSKCIERRERKGEEGEGGE